jgi:hypothetical protein
MLKAEGVDQKSQSLGLAFIMNIQDELFHRYTSKFTFTHLKDRLGA